jgi:hypothetical protein
MGIVIESANNGNKASVSGDSRLKTSGKTNPRIFYVTRDDEQVYSFTSAFSANTGEEVISVKNTSDTLNLYIQEIIVSSVNAAEWELLHVTSGTAAGTTVNGKNMNLASNNVAAATSFGNAAVTGTLAGETIAKERSVAGDSIEFRLKSSLALGKNSEIAITYTGSTGAVDVFILCYFDRKKSGL